MCRPSRTRSTGRRGLHKGHTRIIGTPGARLASGRSCRSATRSCEGDNTRRLGAEQPGQARRSPGPGALSFRYQRPGVAGRCQERPNRPSPRRGFPGRTGSGRTRPRVGCPGTRQESPVRAGQRRGAAPGRSTGIPGSGPDRRWRYRPVAGPGPGRTEPDRVPQHLTRPMPTNRPDSRSSACARPFLRNRQHSGCATCAATDRGAANPRRVRARSRGDGEPTCRVHPPAGRGGRARRPQTDRRDWLQRDPVRGGSLHRRRMPARRVLLRPDPGKAREPWS